MFPRERFVEVYVRASVEECIRRDKKGLYRKAISGKIRDFTGVSAPYEVPDSPDLVLDTESTALSECVETLLSMLARRALLRD